MADVSRRFTESVLPMLQSGTQEPDNLNSTSKLGCVSASRDEQLSILLTVNQSMYHCHQQYTELFIEVIISENKPVFMAISTAKQTFLNMLVKFNFTVLPIHQPNINIYHPLQYS